MTIRRHSYVIDFQEAKKVFKNVREPTEAEEEMLVALPSNLDPRMPREVGTTIVAVTPPIEEGD